GTRCPNGSTCCSSHQKRVVRVHYSISVPLDDKRFCVGPDARLPMWYGRRSQLDLDREPWRQHSQRPHAKKQLIWNTSVGRCSLSGECGGRPTGTRSSRHFQESRTLPSDGPLPVPVKASLRALRMRHPGFQPSDIMVSTSPDPQDSPWSHAGLRTFPRLPCAHALRRKHDGTQRAPPRCSIGLGVALHSPLL
ncbi:hypothetical protein GY45DRAFT_1427965, partial [Cubamyces sp. BRFM 1775]